MKFILLFCPCPRGSLTIASVVNIVQALPAYLLSSSGIPFEFNASDRSAFWSLPFSSAVGTFLEKKRLPRSAYFSSRFQQLMWLHRMPCPPMEQLMIPPDLLSTPRKRNFPKMQMMVKTRKSQIQGPTWHAWVPVSAVNFHCPSFQHGRPLPSLSLCNPLDSSSSRLGHHCHHLGQLRYRLQLQLFESRRMSCLCSKSVSCGCDYAGDGP